MTYQLTCGDCLEVMRSMEADSVDLVFGSPPYEDCRTYGIDFALKDQAWVDWMVEVYVEASRICTGLVAFVVEGKTKKFRWSATPALLIADLHRAGLNLRKPPIFHRVGIPGSGGPDWLRNDFEFIVCVTRPGKLPWSDNTACGHPPKFAPGGAMSYRNQDGVRKNARGCSGNSWQENGKPLSRGRNKDGSPKKRAERIEHAEDGTAKGDHDRLLNLKLANPGNVLKYIVGGGVMGGDEFCSQNEAPFPERLAEFFVQSFCPPAGRVLDCFSGSGTTVAVAHRLGRHGIGIDVRQSQVDLARRRCESETPLIAGLAD